MTATDPHAQQALRVSAEGLDADPWLRAYLDAQRAQWRIDAAGIIALGLDGHARVHAKSGSGATRAAQAKPSAKTEPTAEPAPVAEPSGTPAE